MPKTKKRSVRSVKTTKDEGTYFDRLEDDIKSNQNTLSLVLGALIVIVVGILLFNYFNKPKPQISDNAANQQQTQPTGDVAPGSLPGKYTIKDGDTLFNIAEKYYGDGYKYTEIASANNMADVNSLSTGQEITIPKVENTTAAASASPAATPTDQMAQATPNPSDNGQGTGGNGDTVWGPKISTDTYTVVEGDWLSTIAARAYGDIQSYDKIAKANNIADPNLIEPGMVLKLPR